MESGLSGPYSTPSCVLNVSAAKGFRAFWGRAVLPASRIPERHIVRIGMPHLRGSLIGATALALAVPVAIGAGNAPAAAVTPQLVTPALASATAVSSANAAAGWLAGQLVDGAIPSTWTPGTNDWGLTADTVLALTSRKVAQDAASAATDKLAANVDAYSKPQGASSRSAGAIAKLLLVAVAQGRDPQSFGGVDLPATLAALRTTTGVNAGRYQDVGTTTDYSSDFSQSLAIIALSRHSSVPEDAVRFLLGTQCPNGGFPYSPDDVSKCASNSDASGEATAMVVEALLAPGAANVTGANQARAAGANYLLGVQKASGAFDAPPWVPDNANSTGLIGSALRAAGQTSAADKAVAWLAPLQVTCVNGTGSKAAGNIGAVMADPDSLSGAISAGIPDLDSPRRATSQAVLAYVGSDDFNVMNTAGASASSPAFICTPPKILKVPAAPAISTVAWKSNRKTARVSFVAGATLEPATSFSYRALKIAKGSKWSSWNALGVSMRSFSMVNGYKVEVRANNKAGSSSTSSALVNVTTMRGSLAGCKAVSGLGLTRSTTKSAVTFTKRKTNCARFRISNGGSFGKWKKLKSGSNKISARAGVGRTARVQVQTGKTVTTVYVTR